ncbi:unnamed protein product, partial [Laminaria digitata]
AGTAVSCDEKVGSKSDSEPSGGAAAAPLLLLFGLASWARSTRQRKACSVPASPSFFPAFASPSSSSSSSTRSFYSACSMEREGSQLRSKDAERLKGCLPHMNGSERVSLAHRTGSDGRSRGSGGGSEGGSG